MHVRQMNVDASRSIHRILKQKKCKKSKIYLRSLTEINIVKQKRRCFIIQKQWKFDLRSSWCQLVVQ